MTATILVVDDEENFRLNLLEILGDEGYEAIGVGTLTEARELISKNAADIVLLDVTLPDGKGPVLLAETMRMPYRPEFILITSSPEWEIAVTAMKDGALDFLAKPVDFARLDAILKKALDQLAMRRELELYRQAQRTEVENFYIGDTSAMRLAVELAQRGAMAQAPILITGANGTGKGVLATAIHQWGPRSKGLLVHVNSSAVARDIVESEMFGHEQGAFTDAKNRKIGFMELANGGILFLDEISAMSLEMQAKILTAIEDHKFWRVGGKNPIKTDVQVVAASNRNLPLMIDEGAFRSDLYYRLKVVEIHLPTLAERREDIPALVGRFIEWYNMNSGLNVRSISPRALEALKNYSWPGNIRELKNAIERAMILCDDPEIDVKHLPIEITGDLVP